MLQVEGVCMCRGGGSPSQELGREGHKSKRVCDSEMDSELCRY